MILATGTIAFAQLVNRSYNCYKLEQQSLAMSFMAGKKEQRMGQPELSVLDGSQKSGAATKVYLEIAFAPEYVNKPGLGRSSVLGKYTDPLLPDDEIDSVSLSLYYKGKAIAYRLCNEMSAGGYYVENKKSKMQSSYHSHAFPLETLAAFRQKYNERDSLFTAGSIVWHDLLVELQDSLPPVKRDLNAVFFIKFKDGRVVRQKI